MERSYRSLSIFYLFFIIFNIFFFLKKKVPGDKLVPPEVTVKDFEKAILTCKPSVNAEDVAKQTAWTKEFGIDGA